jgi:5-methylcytosine-specific restriction endonuclease McrA
MKGHKSYNPLQIGGFKKGHKSGMTGKNQTEETKRKIGLANSIILKGRKLSIEQKTKRAKKWKLRGENSPTWQGGKTKLQLIIRHSSKYKLFVLECMQRDGYICQCCHKKGVYLEVHHIIAFSVLLKKYNIKSYEEAEQCNLLWDSKNGITLCKDCHKLTDTYLMKGKKRNFYLTDVKLD